MASKILSKQIQKFQKDILDWYQKNKRDLPWRRPSLKLWNDWQGDPYKVLVSEIMSQQTQIARVIPKYHAWLQKFPTVFDLASASTRDVLLLWSGLGYNRRALYLQKCAQEIVEKYQGKFPEDEKLLLQLPGIGKYTARALLCFAFDQQVAVVDTNVRKVILTQLCQNHPERSEGSPNKKEDSSATPQNDKTFMTEKKIEDVAAQVLPQGKAYEWNQALMDYAAIALKKEKHPKAQKQSRFKDSDRYYRGEIIRFLLAHNTITTIQLQDHLLQTDKILTEERLEKILLGMQKDKLITREDTAKIQLS